MVYKMLTKAHNMWKCVTQG